MAKTMTMDEYKRKYLRGQLDVEQSDDEDYDRPDQMTELLGKMVTTLNVLASRPDPQMDLTPVHDLLAIASRPVLEPARPKRKFEFTFKRDANGFLTGITATEV